MRKNNIIKLMTSLACLCGLLSIASSSWATDVPQTSNTFEQRYNNIDTRHYTNGPSSNNDGANVAAGIAIGALVGVGIAAIASSNNEERWHHGHWRRWHHHHWYPHHHWHPHHRWH